MSKIILSEDTWNTLLAESSDQEWSGELDAMQVVTEPRKGQ